MSKEKTIEEVVQELIAEAQRLKHTPLEELSGVERDLKLGAAWLQKPKGGVQ